MGLLFAVALLGAPLYVWRFNAFGFDLNALLVLLFIVIGASWLKLLQKGQFQEFIESVKKTPNSLLIPTTVFFFAGTLSLFIGGFDIPKFGQWLVLFAQPITVFFLFRFFASKQLIIKDYIENSAYLLVGLAGLLAIIQYTTLWSLSSDWWGNSNEPKRAIAFFAHPNAFALFVTPLMAWLIPAVYERVTKLLNNRNGIDIFYFGLWLLGAVGLLLSLSRGAWIGFAIACGVFILFSRNKKLIYTGLAAGVIIIGIIAATPNLRYRILLPFYGEKSTVARFSLWDTGFKMISDSPLLGKGLHGFNYNYEKFNADPNLDHYNYPHNILLNFWVDIGLLGALSFLGILAYAFWQGITKRSTKVLGMTLFAVALVVHGLIDIPYLKNDLALVFWLMLAVSE